ncbi:MAG: FHA domain-containing protein [Lachnospiraceae bacterium]|nr:FHA domain-containing protein [Lachnospiraceae bacterium]
MEKEETASGAYIREQKDGYLLLSIPQREESYKEEMLQNNRITGLIPVKTQAFNEHFQYRYEIGSRTTLAEQFHRASPGTAEISALMRQIEDTGKLLEGYLLSQEDLLLSLRDIYFDGQEYCFLYLPDYGKDVRVQLAELLEELMNCLNYEDRSSVSLVYLLHARIRQKGSGILSLRRLCEEILEAQAEEERGYLESRDFGEMFAPRPVKYGTGSENTADLAENGGRPGRGKDRKQGKNYKLQKQGERDYGEKEQSGKGRGGKEKCGGEEGCGEKSRRERNRGGRDREGKDRGEKDRKLQSDTEGQEEPGLGQIFEKLRKLFRRADEAFHGGTADKMAEMSGEFAPWETDEEETAVYGGEETKKGEGGFIQGQFDTVPLGLPQDIPGDTMLLSSVGEQYMLEPMESGRERIIPTGYPFELGKEKRGRGYAFTDSVISRQHARLVRGNGGYYISDLGSLNGTTVNGERLTPNIRRELVAGDVIGFAEIYYIFTCLKQQDDV